MYETRKGNLCHKYKIQKSTRHRTHEKESILRILGAEGMSINKELEKKEMRLLASRFDGTSIADSFTVSNKYNLLICAKKISELSNKYRCTKRSIDFY